MWKSGIKPGVQYALREKRGAGNPVQRVKILKHIRGNKWQAEWIDPNPGLVHFVESQHILVAWRDLRTYLKEEAASIALVKHNEECGYDRRSPIDNALSQVFESVGDEVSYWQGVLQGPPEAIARLRTRANVPPEWQSPVAYTTREGTLILPFDEARELARRFCAAEPAAVLVGVEATEREWSREAKSIGHGHMVPLLNEYRASWALIRQWTGHDPAVAQREEEIQRLERLVWDAVYALQKAGLDRESDRLLRSLDRSRD